MRGAESVNGGSPVNSFEKLLEDGALPQAEATDYGWRRPYAAQEDLPPLRGDTGIGEIGLTLKPSQTMPLSFDVGLQGYTGKREGVTGSLQITLAF